MIEIANNTNIDDFSYRCNVFTYSFFGFLKGGDEYKKMKIMKIYKDVNYQDLKMGINQNRKRKLANIQAKVRRQKS